MLHYHGTSDVQSYIHNESADLVSKMFNETVHLSFGGRNFCQIICLKRQLPLAEFVGGMAMMVF